MPSALSVATLLLLMLPSLGQSAEIMTYSEVISKVKASPSPFAIYLGAQDNLLARMLASGQVPTSGVLVAAVSAKDHLPSPFTGAMISGADLQTIFQAGAGTIVFLTASGVPVPELAVPQMIHGNDPELLGLYFAYLAGAHQGTINLPEFARATGKEDVLVRAYRRSQGSAAGRELNQGTPLVSGRNLLTGQEIKPQDEIGVFYIYTSDPGGRVFLAQIQEIWSGFSALSPNITVICPNGTEPSSAKLPRDFRAVLLQAPGPAIATQGPSPHLVFTSRVDGKVRGVQLNGFQTAETLARLFSMPLPGTERAKVNRDIPLGEVDVIRSSPENDLLVPIHQGPNSP